MPTPEALFGPFRFNPAKRMLWHGETPVQLGSRAFAILEALIETPGRLVSRTELFERAWPGLTVDESNLKVQIGGLRKALGDCSGMIRAEAALGYRFVGEVTKSCGSDAPPTKRRFRAPSTPATPLGRDEVIGRIRELLAKHRLVTILGPGGIGKTTVALAAAGELQDAYADGICFVDLGRVSDTNKVCAAVTGSLELPVDVVPTIEQTLLALHGRRLLLILDSCEHVAETVAELAERILGETRDIDILTTTREALRIGGEVLWRLDPLETPPQSIMATAASVLDYSAVQLFQRTVSQGAVDFQINDRGAETIAEICRRLDGIPLAIEMAASMVVVLGIEDVRRGLDERFSVLSMDRRTVVPRQRSLAATIDWSYSLLPEREQAVLRRLACFAGDFTLDAAIAVASDDEMDVPSVRNAVIQLANKSLLNVNQQVAPPEYRLLDMTRAYVSAAPGLRGERERARERHARYFLDLLEFKNWDAYDPAAERTKLRGYAEEIRAALDWAYPIDPHLGVRLTLAAEMLWLELASVTQSIRYLRLALRYVDADPDVNPGLRARVLVALSSAGASVVAPGHDEATLYEQAWEAARFAQDDFLQTRALQTLMTFLLRKSPLSRNLDQYSHYLDQLSIIAARSDSPAVQHLPLVYAAYRDVEISNIVSSAHALEAFISNCPYVPRKYHFGAGLVLMCRVTFALTRFWMGYSDQARRLFDSLVEEAEHRANSPTLCYALVHGAFYCELLHGNFQRAGAYLKKLEGISTLYKPWQGMVTAYRALLIRDECKDLHAAESLLSHALQNEPFLKTQGGLFPRLLIELARTRLMLGDLDGSEETLKEAMSYCSDDQDARIIGRHHCVLAGVLVARNRPGDLETARHLVRRAIDVTNLREIFLLEFDATLDLAELELASGCPVEAQQLVSQLLARAGDRQNMPGTARARDILKRAATEANAFANTPRQASRRRAH